MKLHKSSLGFQLAILIASFLSATISFAAPPQLLGQYTFTGEASCLASTTVKGGTALNGQGFNSSDFTAKDKSFVISFSVQGIRTFNGDGTGKVAGATVDTAFDNETPSGSAHTFTFKFTYVVNPDGTLTTVVVPGTYSGTITAGPRTGQTVTVDNIILAGIASLNNMTLTLATPSPTIETHSFSNGDVQQRICHRSRVLTWMGL